MRSVARWAGLALLLVAFVFPATSADTKKKDGDDKAPAKKKHEEEYVVINQYDGVITSVTSGQRTFSATVTVYVPDEAAVRHMAELQQKLAGTRDAGTIKSLLVQIRGGAETKVDRTFETSEDVKVRAAELPVQFDENGKRKKYTAAELKQKRGTGNVWGYPAEFDQLAKGSNVKLFVSVKKSTAEAMKKRKKTTRTTTRTKPKEPELDLTEDDPPLVRTIYILPETKKPG